jgi:hypothetical protein
MSKCPIKSHHKRPSLLMQKLFEYILPRMSIKGGQLTKEHDLEVQ